MVKRSIGDGYPPNWDEIAEYTKQMAGYRCIKCHSPSIEGRILTVHHLDMHPANCAWWNLTALCQVCHLHVQAVFNFQQLWLFDRWEWIKPYQAGYFAHLRGLPEDRPYVLAHLDELLESIHFQFQS